MKYSKSPLVAALDTCLQLDEHKDQRLLYIRHVVLALCPTITVHKI
jgi:hypothetical protein